VTLAVVGGSGCFVQTSARIRTPPPITVRAEASTPPPATATVTVTTSQPTVATGVTVVEVTCAQGAQEVCNGLDDNCNGQIDEGCGYSSGNIQITLHWNSGADIDMYVSDPQGETINYAHPRSASGGHLDHDARGACRGDQENNTIENVYWDQQQPGAGTYQVDLHYWGECNSGAGPTATTLSIAVGGQMVGSYNYTLSPNERVTVASFSI
jgi:uncharacterized protein YfaP (DUF2135 family)